VIYFKSLFHTLQKANKTVAAFCPELSSPLWKYAAHPHNLHPKYKGYDKIYSQCTT